MDLDVKMPSAAYLRLIVLVAILSGCASQRPIQLREPTAAELGQTKEVVHKGHRAPLQQTVRIPNSWRVVNKGAVFSFENVQVTCLVERNLDRGSRTLQDQARALSEDFDKAPKSRQAIVFNSFSGFVHERADTNLPSGTEAWHVYVFVNEELIVWVWARYYNFTPEAKEEFLRGLAIMLSTVKAEIVQNGSRE